MNDPPDLSTPPPSSQPPPPPWPVDAKPRAGDEVVPAVTWNGGRALLGLAALIVISIFSVIVASAFDPDIESLGARLVLQVLLAAAMIGVAFAVANPAGGLVSPSLLGLRRPRRSPIVPSLIAYFAYVGCAVVIGLLLSPEQEDVTRELGVDESVFGAIFAGILIIGAAPLSEEIFFRGFMFAGLRRSGGFWVGAVVSSAIWGLFHYTGPDSWAVCLQLALFGIALCWLYERTGSIWPTIALHTFNNALAFTLLTSS